MFLFFISCNFESPSNTDTQNTTNVDVDGDGHPASQDCDDNDPLLNSDHPFSCVWSTIPPCASSQDDIIKESSLEPPESGSNRYIVPTEETRTHLALSIQAAIRGDSDGALQEANYANYTLCSEDRTLLWYGDAGSGRAVLALRTHPAARDVIIETPHSFFDLGTLEEGYAVFQNTNARALLASGTHRCASDTSSECSGQTRVCTLTSSEPFRISDMAHTDTSFFHVAHMVVADSFPETTIIQFHMFLDPGISISNGKTRDTTPDSPSARFTDALTVALPDQLVTSCNDYGAGNYEERTCGTSNTQGRYLNDSDYPCGEGASEASGRFIHMEQSRVVIDQSEAISEAINATF